MKFPGVVFVAVLCVVPPGLVVYIGITSCTFPPWIEMSKKNDYGLWTMDFLTMDYDLELTLEVRAKIEKRKTKNSNPIVFRRVL